MEKFLNFDTFCKALKKKIKVIMSGNNFILGKVPITERNDAVFIINNEAALSFFTDKLRPQLRRDSVRVSSLLDYTNINKKALTKLTKKVKGHIRNTCCAVVIRSLQDSDFSR